RFASDGQEAADERGGPAHFVRLRRSGQIRTDGTRRKDLAQRGPCRVRITVAADRWIVSSEGGCVSLEDETMHGAEKPQRHGRVERLAGVRREDVPGDTSRLDVRDDVPEEAGIERGAERDADGHLSPETGERIPS